MAAIPATDTKIVELPKVIDDTTHMATIKMEEIKRRYKEQKDKGRLVREKRLVDVCIPAYKEEGYIERTLDRLMRQSLWRDGAMNIVVGEYSDKYEHLRYIKNSYLREICIRNGIIHLYVPELGMGYARNYTIDKGSVSDIICNLDADCKFNSDNGVELLVRPIFHNRGKIVSTYCEVVMVEDDNPNRKQSVEERLYRGIYRNVVILEKNSPFGRSIGLTMERRVFYRINGFPLINALEDYVTNYRISYYFGMFSRKFVDGVKVLASDRRARALSGSDGIKAIKYDKDYR